MKLGQSNIDVKLNRPKLVDGRFSATRGLPTTPSRVLDGFVFESCGQEALVYDSNLEQAHCLSREVVAVLELCDGYRSLERIADQTGQSRALVRQVVAELQSMGLIAYADVQHDELTAASGATRRRVALGATTIALGGLVASVIAPEPSFAESNCTQNTGSFCSFGDSNPPGFNNTCCRTRCCCQRTVGGSFFCSQPSQCLVPVICI